MTQSQDLVKERSWVFFKSSEKITQERESENIIPLKRDEIRNKEVKPPRMKKDTVKGDNFMWKYWNTDSE